MSVSSATPSATAPLPALFVSHGAPLFAVDTGSSGPALQAWGTALRERHDLKGVVVMSPHWMPLRPTVMAHAQPETWHDFGGFPPALYELQYPAPGSPALAERVRVLLDADQIPVVVDDQRPRDHGAWVPLMHLFPQADVPAIQLGLPLQAKPADVFRMGRALRGLRDEGILLMGSGSMTHNLREFFGGMPPIDSEPAPYVVAFARWVEALVMLNDKNGLLRYEQIGPNAKRAHPEDDHFLPLFFALGASDWAEGDGIDPDYITREVMYGMLAMDALALPPASATAQA